LTTVVAAVLEANGRILIAQRRAGTPHELKWEFPGGKVDAGESPETALRRELAEELAIDASIGPEIVRYEYAYPGKPAILLIFYRVLGFSGDARNQVFERILWVEKEHISSYDFLEGDLRFLKVLGQ
jgi:8-oxo-dGTP diphosphatase